MAGALCHGRIDICFSLKQHAHHSFSAVLCCHEQGRAPLIARLHHRTLTLDQGRLLADGES